VLTTSASDLKKSEQPLSKEEILSQLADLIGGERDDNRLDVVQVDGQVVLKIIKHCKEPEVTGQLLGLDFGTRLEVTNCFPLNIKIENEEEEDAKLSEYQLEMMKHLREVNIDNNTVGWYISTVLGSFVHDGFMELIDSQFYYQSNIPKSVLLLYDPLRAKQGSLYLKAYRLTDAFMDLFKNKDFTQENLIKTGLTFNDILDEIPVEIHNSHVINALLYELEDSFNSGLDFERLNLSSNPFLEKHLESLTETVDMLTQLQNKYQFWQKNMSKQDAQKAAYLLKKRQDIAQRRQAGEDINEGEDVNTIFKTPPQPSRLDSLLITNQISNYCKQINQHAGQSFSKLYTYAGLHK